MKYTWRIVLISMIAIWIFTASECNKPSLKKIPTFSYLEPIVNPPDTFQISYNLRIYGDKSAHVTFADSAVWAVERLGDSHATIRIKHGDTSIIIFNSDTLAFQANQDYVFVANNNNYEINNFFIQLTKLPLDYHTFNPKFK